ERDGCGIEESHRRAGTLVPILAGDAPASVAFSEDCQPAQAAAIAHGSMRGVDFLRRPGLVLGRSAVDNFAPLYRPPGLRAVDLKDVAVALVIQEHERDDVRSLSGVSPAPAVVQ